MKKLISLILALILVLSAFPAASFAAPNYTPGIFICGVQVNDVYFNHPDIVKSGTVSYEPHNNILTLDNAVITTDTDVIRFSGARDLTIEVIGNCEISMKDQGAASAPHIAAIFSSSDYPLHFMGSGTLKVTTDVAAASGILVNSSDISVDGCSLIVETKNGHAIAVYRSFTADNASLELSPKGNGRGIEADSIAIRGSNVKITTEDVPALSTPYYDSSYGPVRLENSTVSVKTTCEWGIATTRLEAVGGKVTIETGGDVGNSVNADCSIADSDFTVKSMAGNAFKTAPDLSGFAGAFVDYGDSESEALRNVAYGPGFDTDNYNRKYVRIHPEDKPEPAPAPEETGPRGSKGSDGVPVVIGRNPYSGNGVWLAGAGQHAAGPEGIGIFRADVPFSKFKGVAVDGKTLSAGDYRAYEGSTIVELEGSFLKSLGDGAHTISITFTDGKAETDFYIGSEENPDTGAPLSAGLLTLGALVIAAAVRKH